MNSTPQGLLRINIPAAFGRRYIVPHLDGFLSAYPDVRVDATLTDATADPIESGADAAVRNGALMDSTLIANRLASQLRALVASPRHIIQYGPVAEPAALEGRDCLTFALQPFEAWYFRPHLDPAPQPRAVLVTGRLRANDSEALRDAALSGLGIALLPTWLVGPDMRAGRLVELLPTWQSLLAPGAERAIWFVYPPKGIVSPKVRASAQRVQRKHNTHLDLRSDYRIGVELAAGQPRVPACFIGPMRPSVSYTRHSTHLSLPIT